MKTKITKNMIQKLAPYQGKPIFYYDTDLTGFGIKVGAKRKAYFAEAKIHGRTVRKTFASICVLTPEQARVQAKQLLASMAKGVDVNAESRQLRTKSITLLEAFADYKKLRHLTAGTLYGYEEAMNTLFKDWQNKAITSINRDMIERKFLQKTEESPAVANMYFRFLRALFNFAMEKYSTDGEPLIPSNPCNRLTVLKMWNRVEPRTSYIQPAQIRSFFYGLKVDDFDRDRKRVAKNQCMVTLFTGCRDQEVARLRRGDINFENKTVTFLETKNHHTHVLPFGTWLGDFLKELCDGLEPDEFLFPADNKCGHIKDHKKVIKEISKDCGVPFTLHDIRRTFATIVDHHLGHSFSPYTIKRLLNHSRGDVTAGYIQYGVEDLRSPMQQIENFILEQAGILPKPADNVVKLDIAKK